MKILKRACRSSATFSSPKSHPELGALVTALLALAPGCTGPEASFPFSPPPPSSATTIPAPGEEPTPSQTHPSSCAELRAAVPEAGDGEYLLYVQGDVTRAWAAWCQDMAGTPTEYLTLAAQGAEANFSEYLAGGPSPGSTVRTVYTRLRIDPATLAVNTADQRFSTSSGQLTHSPSTVTSMPYATAMSCTGEEPLAQASIDLRGTSFSVLPDQLATRGSAPDGDSLYGDQLQTVQLRGGGFCGWTSLAGSFNPFNQNGGTLGLQQGASSLPETCAELHDRLPGAGDGSYVLYVSKDLSRPWLAYCQGMQGNPNTSGAPLEYLTLARTGPEANVSQYLAGGPSYGTTVRTAYTRLRIDPVTLVVDTADQRFSTSSGQLSHSDVHGNIPVASMPYATAMACACDGQQGQASIDLRGTPFSVPGGQFETGGAGPYGGSLPGEGLQTVQLHGGGCCGWTSLAGSFNPFNQSGGGLQLSYGAPVLR